LAKSLSVSTISSQIAAMPAAPAATAGHSDVRWAALKTATSTITNGRIEPAGGSIAFQAA
jgi:hypothetical protein